MSRCSFPMLPSRTSVVSCFMFKSLIHHKLIKKIIYLFGCAGSQLWRAESSLGHVASLVVGCRLFQLWHVGYFTAVCEPLVVACGIQFPDLGSNPGPLHWEFTVLAIGPPGKSPLQVNFWEWYKIGVYCHLLSFQHPTQCFLIFQ